MKIRVYTVCWNEALMLPHFLRHYRFAEEIVVYDHGSTDNSAAIVRSFPNTTLRRLHCPDEIHESYLLHVKNHAYRECRGQADFVVVVDVDEFLYHPAIDDVLARYKAEGVTVPKVKGYNMVSDRFPRLNEEFLQIVRRGVADDTTVEDYINAYGKRCVFDPSVEINFQPGCHECDPRGGVRESASAEIMLLHCKFMGLEYTLKRHGEYRRRLSEEMIRKGWWYQYTWPDGRVAELFNAMRSKARAVL